MAKVLVVDDERIIRIIHRDILWDEGHEVYTAEDADRGMALLKIVDFNVVVTDINLPRVTGLELLKSIRSASSDVQVIMMTGDLTGEMESAAMRAGAYDYLCKPISKEMIVKCVANAAKVKALDEELWRLDEGRTKNIPKKPSGR